MTQSSAAANTNQEQAGESARPANKPVEKLRIGNITANIWRNTGQNGDFHTITFERSYPGADGKLKSTDSFSAADLPVIEKLAPKALDRVIALEQGRARS